MEKEIASFVSRCLTCQQVKAEHQRTVGKIQLLPIPVWKWEKCKVFIKWASLIEINWIKFGLIK